MPPSTALAPPDRPDPAPRGTTRHVVRGRPPHGGLDLLRRPRSRTTAIGVPAPMSRDQSWRYVRRRPGGRDDCGGKGLDELGEVIPIDHRSEHPRRRPQGRR